MRDFAQGRGGWKKNRGHMADIPRIIFPPNEKIGQMDHLWTGVKIGFVAKRATLV
jgi:hypothetical protein